MMNATKLSYALVLGILSFAGCSRAMEPVDRQPVQEMAATFKSNGQVRIAQGMAGILEKDANTGKLTMARALLMVTSNENTLEWTVSVIQGQTGSTWLMGSNFRPSAGDVAILPIFDRQKVKPDPFYPEEAKGLAALGYRSCYRGRVTFTMKAALDMAAVYRQQEIDANVLKLNVDGENIEISQGELRNIMTKRVKELEAERIRLGGRPKNNEGDDKSSGPDFRAMKPFIAEVLATSNGAFCVLIMDEEGRCATIAIGDAFSEKR